MSNEDMSSSETEDDTTQNHGSFTKKKGNEESAEETDECEEWPVQDERETGDLSTDESQKQEACEPSGNHKNEKKTEKPCKPKVKIKTLTIDGQLVYFCKICDKIFTRRKDKLNHELAHSGESVLTCTECGKEYLHESSLASHMRTHDGDPLYMCDLCPKMFAQSHHLKTHILSHSEPTNFTCKICYKEFPTAAELGHHNRIQIKHEMTQYWCKMCKIYFCRNHDICCTKRLHAYCCSACNELFYTHKKLKIHMKKFAHFSEEKPKYIEPLQEHELYPDKIPEHLKKLQAQRENDLMKNAPKTNQPSKRQLDENAENEKPAKKFKLLSRKVFWEENHSSTSLQDSAPEIKVEAGLKSPNKHRKGKPYCKKCNKSFKDTAELDRHKALVHEERQETFLCDVCSMGFRTKDELERHGFKHTGERMHMCPMCGEEFPHSLQLTKHLRMHVGDFPYRCSQCGKAFRLKIQLIQHVRLHIAQDANACEKCPAKFSTQTELQDHIAHLHGEADSFQCHLCSKSFPFRYKLVNHLRLHTNVKCFQCYICHKNFATKHYLQRHLQVHIKQGMDVDIQNIIIDEDSKSELETIKEQITKENLQNSEGQRKRPSLDSIDEKHLKKTFPGIKRSVSNIEMESRTQNMSDLDCEAAEKRFRNICDNKIKVEIEDRSDSASEQSFCSSFTRDSEKSDQYRFSSDESFSFKTTMAKERRRLKRKWRKNRELVLQSGSSHWNMNDCSKDEELNGTMVCPDSLGEDMEEEEDVTDMMVELNGVRSECDNVTTVYVSLTQMKSQSVTKNVKTDITESSITFSEQKMPLRENIDFSDKISHAIANSEDGTVKSDPEATMLQLVETQSIEQSEDEKPELIKGSNTLVFEIDAEHLKESDFNVLKDIDFKVNTQTGKYDIHEKAVEPSNSASCVETDRSKNATPLTNSSSNLENDGNHGTNLMSGASNLDRLKAVFENSSKYLPLTHSSGVPSHSTASPQHNVTQVKGETVGDNQNKSNTKTMHDKSANHLENQQVYIPSPSPRKISVLPSLNQNISQTKENKHSDATNLNLGKSHIASPSEGFDRYRKKASEGLTEGTFKFQSATLQSSREKESSVKSLPAPNQHSTISGQSVINDSHVHRPTSTHHGQVLSTSNLLSTSSLPHHTAAHIYTTSSVSLASNPVAFSSFCPPSSHLVSGGEGPPLPPPTPGNKSQGSGMLYDNQSADIYRGNTTRLPNFVSGPGHSNLPPTASSQNLQYGATSITSCNMNDAVISSISGGLPHSTSLLSNNSLTGNLLANPNSISGQSGGSGNTNLQLAAPPGNFPLNPSSIFDTNNPVYRDMNMLDLVSPTHTNVQSQFSTSNALPGGSSYVNPNVNLIQQQNAEAQLRQNLIAFVEAQNMGHQQSQHPVLPLGNPPLGINVENPGNFMNNSLNQGLLPGNPLNNTLNPGLMPSNLAVNYGQADSTLLSLGFGGNVGDPMHTRNMYDSLPRDNLTGIVAGLPQPSLNIGSTSGLLPLNAACNFPLNTGGIGSFGPLASSNMGIAVSLGSSYLGGPGLQTGNLPSLNTPSLGCGLPMNATANPHIMNNMNLNHFVGSGLPDGLRNILTPAGMNLLNPSLAAQNMAPLGSNSLAFINSGNPGFFPNF